MLEEGAIFLSFEILGGPLVGRAIPVGDLEKKKKNEFLSHLKKGKGEKKKGSNQGHSFFFTIFS